LLVLIDEVTLVFYGFLGVTHASILTELLGVAVEFLEPWVGGIHILIILTAPSEVLLVVTRVQHITSRVVESESYLEIYLRSPIWTISCLFCSLDHSGVVPYIIIGAVDLIIHLQSETPIPILIAHVGLEGRQIPGFLLHLPIEGQFVAQPTHPHVSLRNLDDLPTRPIHCARSSVLLQAVYEVLFADGVTEIPLLLANLGFFDELRVVPLHHLAELVEMPLRIHN
jgi:hypothetical protein